MAAGSEAHCPELHEKSRIGEGGSGPGIWLKRQGWTEQNPLLQSVKSNVVWLLLLDSFCARNLILVKKTRTKKKTRPRTPDPLLGMASRNAPQDRRTARRSFFFLKKCRTVASAAGHHLGDELPLVHPRQDLPILLRREGVKRGRGVRVQAGQVGGGGWTHPVQEKGVAVSQPKRCPAPSARPKILHPKLAKCYFRHLRGKNLCQKFPAQ